MIRSLIINPGSTSTKIGVFEDETQVLDKTLRHEADEIVEVMNLKADPDLIPRLVQADGICPAWHMNKKHWISVLLDDTLEDAAAS